MIPIHASASIFLPKGLTSVSKSSFARNAAEQIVIPDGVTQIASGAFANCPNLKAVVIPASVESIASDAFKGNGFVVIICEKKSAAMRYAENCYMPYALK